MAAVSCRWIVDFAWLADSASFGRLLPEERYGARLACSPFAGKLIALSDRFRQVTS